MDNLAGRSRMFEEALNEWGTEMEYEEIKFLPLGDLLWDHALGGGLPQGQFVELFGPAGSGKSTVAYMLAAAVQRSGGVVALVDLDGDYDPEWVAKCGVNLNELLLLDIDSPDAEDEVEFVLDVAYCVDMIIIDSLDASENSKEMLAALSAVSELVIKIVTNPIIEKQTSFGVLQVTENDTVKRLATTRIFCPEVGKATVVKAPTIPKRMTLTFDESGLS
jgi:predicted ATP-dependent serine protease